jgi:hypothetical protein
MGEDPFGLGGFGYGGAGGPGLGMGAFGYGSMGIGVDLVCLSGHLSDDGVYRLTLRTLSPDGQAADLPLPDVTATTPPRAANSITPLSYDAQTSTLFLQIQ